MSDTHGVAGKYGYLVNGPLLDACDPFWIDAQNKTRTHVRQYVKRAGLDRAEHSRLLDILGLSPR